MTTADTSGRRVFLSYAYDDIARAQQLMSALAASGITVSNRDPVHATTTQQVQAHLSEAIRTSDLLIVLFSSAAAGSRWVQWEIDQVASGKLRMRGVTVIPVRLDETPLPAALARRRVVDLTNDFGSGVQALVREVATAQHVDFKRLDHRAFEDLIGDLLKRVGFSVERQPGTSGATVDMRATRAATDPFGGAELETWLVECKLYGSGGRMSVEAIRQVAGLLATAPVTTRGLLVTTAQVTSVAREYLDDVERTARVRLRLLDGEELAALLRQQPDLVARYFNDPGTARDNA